MNAVIVISEKMDWAGVYLNGNLIWEHHPSDLNLSKLKELLPCTTTLDEIREVDVDPDWKFDALPKVVGEVKF